MYYIGSPCRPFLSCLGSLTRACVTLTNTWAVSHRGLLPRRGGPELRFREWTAPSLSSLGVIDHEIWTHLCASSERSHPSVVGWRAVVTLHCCIDLRGLSAVLFIFCSYLSPISFSLLVLLYLPRLDSLPHLYSHA